MNKQMHLFGTETRLEKISKPGDPLLKINELIDWEMFRSPIEHAIRVTDASVHDSQEFVGLIGAKDQEVSAGSGYAGERFQEEILSKHPCIKIHICARACRNTPLADEDRTKNRSMAHTRVRIEHIFGYMTRFMSGITSRVHGLERVTRDVTAKNMAYNLKRYVCIMG